MAHAESKERPRVRQVCIRIAPLPDLSDPKTCASHEFAQRASRLLVAGDAAGPVKVDVEQLASDHNPLLPTTQPSSSDDDDDVDAATTTTTLQLLLVACAADGSVHRNVRKFLRGAAAASSRQRAQKDQDSHHHGGSSYFYYATVLLGHARCANSANQMDDTIYRTGRKLDRTLADGGIRWCDGLELQAELVGPAEHKCRGSDGADDVSFDQWVGALLTPHQQATNVRKQGQQTHTTSPPPLPLPSSNDDAAHSKE